MSRRIDLTIERLAAALDELSPVERERLGSERWWGVVVTVQRLRAMERAELEVIPLSRQDMADAYDREVQPGEHPVHALIKTFGAVYGAHSQG